MNDSGWAIQFLNRELFHQVIRRVPSGKTGWWRLPFDVHWFQHFPRIEMPQILNAFSQETSKWIATFRAQNATKSALRWSANLVWRRQSVGGSMETGRLVLRFRILHRPFGKWATECTTTGLITTQRRFGRSSWKTAHGLHAGQRQIASSSLLRSAAGRFHTFRGTG